MGTSIVLSLIAAFGGFTQGLTGVGIVTVALPLIALIVDMKTVIPMVGLLAVSINIVLGWQLRGSMRWRLCLPLLIGAVPGIPAGVYVLKTLPSSLLQTVLGVVFFIYGLYAVMQTSVQKDLSSVWAWLAGFLAGGLGGSIGASGPPIIVYTSIQPWSKDTIKATMIAFFLCTTIGISSMHAASGLITSQVLSFYAVSLPGLSLGCILGVFCTQPRSLLGHPGPPGATLAILGSPGVCLALSRYAYARTVPVVLPTRQFLP